jgi:hypothetical protein
LRRGGDFGILLRPSKVGEWEYCATRIRGALRAGPVLVGHLADVLWPQSSL